MSKISDVIKKNDCLWITPDVSSVKEFNLIVKSELDPFDKIVKLLSYQLDSGWVILSDVDKEYNGLGKYTIVISDDYVYVGAFGNTKQVKSAFYYPKTLDEMVIQLVNEGFIRFEYVEIRR